jgi:hypothetical protein
MICNSDSKRNMGNNPHDHFTDEMKRWQT